MKVAIIGHGDEVFIKKASELLAKQGSEIIVVESFTDVPKDIKAIVSSGDNGTIVLDNVAAFFKVQPINNRQDYELLKRCDDPFYFKTKRKGWKRPYKYHS